MVFTCLSRRLLEMTTAMAPYAERAKADACADPSQPTAFSHRAMLLRRGIPLSYDFLATRHASSEQRRTTRLRCACIRAQERIAQPDRHRPSMVFLAEFRASSNTCWGASRKRLVLCFTSYLTDHFAALKSARPPCVLEPLAVQSVESSVCCPFQPTRDGVCPSWVPRFVIRWIDRLISRRLRGLLRVPWLKPDDCVVDREVSRKSRLSTLS